MDLARDPEYPQIVYAALWTFRMHPWLDYFQPQVGMGSGIYKSKDRGENWERLDGAGLPEGPLGRIGLAVAPGSRGRFVYATVAAAGKGSGLYCSHDGGMNWTLVKEDAGLADTYFSRITVNPQDSNDVYVMGRSIRRSTDGGRTFSIFKGAPGGDDYHFLWINPLDPTTMITASDQGCVATVDGGKTWSSWYNQPTGQFYHLAVDDQFPYKIYSGQQDNGTVSISSRGPYGVIEERDWHPVGGDERDYMVPKPGDPSIVFGSGLGGYVSRFNEVTRQVANVSPWPVGSYAARPSSVRYRYTWITPLAFSPLGSHALYMGAQVLFRSVDDGNHWDVISPDLSGKSRDTANCSDPDLGNARDCGFGVIYTIAPSNLEEKQIWIGTDDGLIQRTTDGGKRWSNVTPHEIPLWGRVTSIDPSYSSPRKAYVAVDLHRLGRSEPLLLKTPDGGKNWETINHGLPRDEYTTVLRCDPKRDGLLYAGTNRGVYVSFDDGEYWQSLSLNFPTTWVRDLVVHENDLVAGTQGRGIWVLDDLSPLRQMNETVMSGNVFLFRPAAAWRLRGNENHDTPPPPSTPLGQNPPTGAVLDYWMKDSTDGEVTLTISDAVGKVVRRFSSNDKKDMLNANQYFQQEWLGLEDRLSTTQGMHRFVWDLRYQRPSAIGYSYSIAAVWPRGHPIAPQGPLVLPGNRHQQKHES